MDREDKRARNGTPGTPEGTRRKPTTKEKVEPRGGRKTRRPEHSLFGL